MFCLCLCVMHGCVFCLFARFVLFFKCLFCLFLHLCGNQSVLDSCLCSLYVVCVLFIRVCCLCVLCLFVSVFMDLFVCLFVLLFA